jgi:hypothetical protein
MKTEIVSFRLEESKLALIDEIIVMQAERTGIKTRSGFVLRAIDYLIANIEDATIENKMLTKIAQVKAENEFWRDVEAELQYLSSNLTKQRAQTAIEMLDSAEEFLTRSTFTSDIEAWRQNISEKARHVL